MDKDNSNINDKPRLKSSNLGKLPPGIEIPSYDRSRVNCSIVHIGVGGFHRAHQAVYIDDLIKKLGINQWGICGVGLLWDDKKMEAALVPQDCLYTVVARDESRDKFRVVGSIQKYLFAPENPQTTLGFMSSPEVRIVTLTITESGYCFNQATGEFESDRPEIKHDLDNPHNPKTVFGYLAESLERRFINGISPYTILSCDNIQSNGNVIKKMLMSFCELRDPDLNKWIKDNVAFPNCMIDRITPGTTDDDKKMVEEKIGIYDAWPVVTEPFRQWVIEDNFCNGRPPWEEVGVQMTYNVLPYEIMKIRLLNASHQAMGYLGYLMGFKYIHQVIKDPEFRLYIQKLMDEEITPILVHIPGVSFDEYKRTLIQRFSNPAIKDHLNRICMDSSSRIPKFVLPTITEQLKRRGKIKKLSLIVASWFRFLTGMDEDGNEFEIKDPMGKKLKEYAIAGGYNPDKLLSIKELFGDLGNSQEFGREVGKALKSLYLKGARATLREYLELNP